MKTILLVEDEAVIALAEREILENLGYTVSVAHSGEAAVEAVRPESGIDLVLMDIDLGDGIDGTQAAQRILMNQALPIVFVSSHSEPWVVKKTESIASYGYIVKSSPASAFDASIKMAFRLFDKNRELLDTKNKLKATLDVIPDLLFVVNRHGFFVDHHVRTDLHRTAIPLERIIGSNISDMLSPEETAVQLELYRSCIETGKVLNHTYTLFVDGITKTYYLQLTRLDNDHVLAIVRDMTEQRMAELRIKNLLDEKDILLKEVHHRIKNSMSTVASLLGIQAGELDDPAAVAALEDSRARIKSMMLLYEKLYQSSDFRAVSLSSYLSGLIDQIVGNFPNRADVVVQKEIQDFILDARHLQPLGIIVTELMTNIMKYAFRDGEGGLVRVAASREAGRIRLSVQDNGNGLPEDVSLENSTGLGFQLIQALVLQLNGTIALQRDPGPKFIVEFPD